MKSLATEQYLSSTLAKEDVSQQGLFSAFKAKDTRFDGRFFVGVSSTKIYCRPVCKAKVPKEENCTFYQNAAEAEQAGYRPCLLCRPELAPGRSNADARTSLALRAARLLEESCGSGVGLVTLAGKLGCTDRHLRRVFSDEFHVSPVQYMQTCRLLLAKNLLTDTSLSVADVAMMSGFGSLRRFNDVFRKHYRLSPTQLRKRAAAGTKPEGKVDILIGYRPPFLWKKLLAYFAKHAIPGIEEISPDEYARTVQLTSHEGKLYRGWIKVTEKPTEHALVVTVPSDLFPVLAQILLRIRRCFDLDSNPAEIGDTLLSMNQIEAGLFVPGTRIPGCFDAFETTVKTVLEQYLLLPDSSLVASRIARKFGEEVEHPVGSMRFYFPTLGKLDAQKRDFKDFLETLKVPQACVSTLVRLIECFINSEIDASMHAEPEKVERSLIQTAGIDADTARILAMRLLCWPDAFPSFEELRYIVPSGLNPEALFALSETWHPWRSYAMVSIWNHYLLES